MKIKDLSHKELVNALPLVWDVFSEYEAAGYSESGKKAFWDAIHSEEYLNMLTAYGAYEKHELVGIIATREAGSHLALFFVDGKYQRQGIGRKLWSAVLEENTSPTITVHSSLYAVEVYKKLGFAVTGEMKQDNGIQYVPMEYRMIVNPNCPCAKTKCIRHGKCNECRAHHEKSNRLRPCERN
ncbi:MAG: GNAT family N-acetyltransferase [Bariatricus sp.]